MKTRLIQIIFFGLLVVIFFFNQGNYEDMDTGYTDAPGEQDCGSCHTPQIFGLNGGVVLEGVPNLVFPNQTYSLGVKVYDSDGPVQPENGGFMLTALDESDAKIGSLSNPSQHTKLFSDNNRNYATHETARSFLGSTDIDTVSYGFNWKAPSTGQTQTVTFYYAAVLGNNPGTPNVINDRVFTETRTVTFVSQLIVGNISVVNQIDCFGQNSGALTVNPTGGLTSYSYLWSNGATSKTASNLTAGTYTVTVTDAAGQSGTASANLTQPTQLNLSLSNTQHVSCFGGSDGQSSALASGGTPAYTYVWSNGQSGANLSNVSAGNYRVTTTDSNGCTKSSSVTITQPPALNLALTQSNQPACFGEANGSISVQASGGTPSYSYAWSNGQTGNSINNIPAGNYVVTVTDSKACTKTQSFTLSQPALLVVHVTSVTHTSGGQNNGAIDITVSGGTGGYAYLWTGPNGFASFSQDLSNLEAGTYHVTATDQNDCTAIVTGGIIVDMESGVDETLQENLVIFPNPASNILYVSLHLEGIDWQVQMLDMAGREQVMVKNLRHESISSIDISALPIGVYAVKITTADGRTTSKLVRVE